MKPNQFLGWSAALCLSAMTLNAQQTNEVEALRQQLREATENFEKVLRQHRELMDHLTKKIEGLDQKQPAETNRAEIVQQAPPAPASRPTPSAEPASAVPALAQPSWSPSQPLTVARAGSAYMNISFDALLDFGGSTDPDVSQRLNLGDHDPQQRGFSLRNAEIALDGAVDPYFKGFANIVFKLDGDQNTGVELEEAYLQTASLPANLQLKAGQFFANFGRQNPQHPHQWAFVDQPVVLSRALGPEGLRNLGAQLSWLVPVPFYTETFLGFFNSQSGQAFSFRNPGEDISGTNRFSGRETLSRGLRGPGDFLYVPRIASSFELTDQQTLVVGASGAFAPNSTGPHTHSQIYGADAYWKWKPANATEGFPFVSLQTEALFRRFEAGKDTTALLPPETLRDWGFYSQVLWGFKPHWVTGLRGEYATGNPGAYDSMDVFRGRRTRLSPVLTWYPSEFSKVRLQYNYDTGQRIDDAHSVWLQLEFLLGAHGAHKF